MARRKSRTLALAVALAILGPASPGLVASELHLDPSPGPAVEAFPPPAPAAADAGERLSRGGQEPAHSPLEGPEPSAPRGPTDPAEMEAFMDGLMHVILEEYETVGAVVSVVSGGEVFFTKGYGYADWEERVPVDPETTLFRIGSVSKLFVWTSVMQMVEDGLLDLDADVNRYLDFEIPPVFDAPVTLGDIMAHAGGFEDYVFGLITTDTADVRPLGEILKEQVPARVRPPGDISSYSNHATGMAAYMVERAAGIPWVEYVEERILEPLGMEHATFRQPLPEALAPDMSMPYRYQGDRFQEGDFEIVALAPVGGAAVSAADMARFMIAHLQLGRYGDGRILEEETARLMQSDHHRMDPLVNGMAHGFMVYDQHGERIIGHGGDTRYFHTGLWLFPERDLGMFVSFNSQASGGARGEVLEGFLERYFPVPEALPAIPEDFRERAERFAGKYRSNRFPHTTFAKVAAFGGEQVRVTGRGTLRALDSHWVEVAPLVFQEESGSRRMIFREGPDGEITHLFLSGTPIMAWERVPSSEAPEIHVVIFFLTILSVVVILLEPAVGWAVRRWYGVPAEGVVRVPGAARWTLRAVAILLVLFGLAFFLAASSGGVLQNAAPVVAGVFLFPVLAILPVAGSLWFSFRLWVKGEGRPSVRVFYSLATVIFCLFLWQLSVWQMLGWNY